MPMDKTRYPADWKAISLRIRERDGNKCKFCGVPNGERGARDKDGDWHEENSIHCMNSDSGYALFGDFPDMIKIVLTVAHLNHDTSDNSDANLAALCQRCHLRHDAAYHAANAARTRRAKRVASGQMEIDLA